MHQPFNRGFRLALVQLVCPDYRLPLIEGIARLPGVVLTLFVGTRNPRSLAPGLDSIPVPHVRLRNRIVRFLGLEVVWQNLSRALRPADYDLVLLPDGMLYLANYVLMMKCWWNKVPVGLYSHGFNHQRRSKWAGSPLEHVRAFIHRRCDILVVYSDEDARHVIEINRVRPERVFVAQNTLDVEGIQARARRSAAADVAGLRQDLGAGSEDVLLVYPGRMVAIKRPEWVIEAVSRLRARGLPVRAVLVGDGERMPLLRDRLATASPDVRDAIRLVGRVPVDQTDRYLLAGDLTVMPGMTGLAIVHSFALGRPYVTVDAPIHSPEIRYLRDGINGSIAPDTVDGFAAAIERLVSHPDLRRAMGQAALTDAATQLTMGRQVQGFRDAIAFIRDRSR